VVERALYLAEVALLLEALAVGQPTGARIIATRGSKP
jgi:hypothetical protein